MYRFNVLGHKSDGRLFEPLDAGSCPNLNHDLQNFAIAFTRFSVCAFHQGKSFLMNQLAQFNATEDAKEAFTIGRGVGGLCISVEANLQLGTSGGLSTALLSLLIRPLCRWILRRRASGCTTGPCH